MAHVKESVKDLVKTKKIFALWSKCAAKFGKVAKCAMGVKSLRTTAIDALIKKHVFFSLIDEDQYQYQYQYLLFLLLHKKNRKK